MDDITDGRTVCKKPCDFVLFSWLKSELKGNHFDFNEKASNANVFIFNKLVKCCCSISRKMVQKR